MATVEDALPMCGWCGQKDKPNSYVLPLKNGRHIFCSEACLFEFKKGACFHCGEAISGTPFQSSLNLVTRDFCSEKCCQKFKKREQTKHIKTSPLASSMSCPIDTAGPPLVLNSSICSFAWEDYLVETQSVAAPKICFKQVFIL